MQEQAKLVVDENAILMQEIELKDRRIDEMQHEFEIEGSFLQMFFYKFIPFKLLIHKDFAFVYVIVHMAMFAQINASSLS